MSDYDKSGVYFDEDSNTWCACIEFSGSIIKLGLFPDAWEAYFEWKIVEANLQEDLNERDAIVLNTIHHIREATKQVRWKASLVRYLDNEYHGIPFELPLNTGPDSAASIGIVLRDSKNTREIKDEKSNTEVETSRAEFVKSLFMTRGAPHMYCGFCGDGYDKWTYQYVCVVSGPCEGAVVCPECLQRGIPGVITPSYEEWLHNEKEVDKEYCLALGYKL